MVEKAKIVKSLGESKLALPGLVNEALAANDRAKYLFTLLQSAKGHADNPAGGHSALAAERAPAGVEYASLDKVVAQSAKVKRGGYRIPGAGRIVQEAYVDVARSGGGAPAR